MMSRSLICLLSCLLCLSCGNSSPSSTNKTKERNELNNQLATFQGIAMTIPYRIEIGKPLNATQKQAVQNAIDATFQEINTIYNKWNPESELSQINRLPANQKMTLSNELAAFLKRCDYFVRLSDGRFDPTIEPIQQLWKKHLENNSLPVVAEIEAIRPAIGWGNIVLSDATISKKHARTALDLGGIAKGYGVDLLTERLVRAGYSHVFVEWGGEVRAAGRHPQGRNWAVYISNLEDLNPEHALAYVPLCNQAIATSGDYLQQWQGAGGETYFHVFDPQTLKPLKMTPFSMASASVLTKECMTADALATMLLMCPTLEEAKLLAAKLQKEVPGSAYWLMSRQECER